MIFKGKLSDLNIHNTFEMRNADNDLYFQVERNNYIPNKVFIKNSIDNVDYVGEINLFDGDKEFILYNDSSKMMSIKQKNSFGAPKFVISSKLSDYTAKFSLREMSLQIFENENKILTFAGNRDEYSLDVDDDCNVFCAMALAYGITLLLNENDA